MSGLRTLLEAYLGQIQLLRRSKIEVLWPKKSIHSVEMARDYLCCNNAHKKRKTKLMPLMEILVCDGLVCHFILCLPEK